MASMSSVVSSLASSCPVCPEGAAAALQRPPAPGRIVSAAFSTGTAAELDERTAADMKRVRGTAPSWSVLVVGCAAAATAPFAAVATSVACVDVAPSPAANVASFVGASLLDDDAWSRLAARPQPFDALVARDLELLSSPDVLLGRAGRVALRQWLRASHWAAALSSDAWAYKWAVRATVGGAVVLLPKLALLATDGDVLRAVAAVGALRNASLTIVVEGGPPPVAVVGLDGGAEAALARFRAAVRRSD